LDDEFDELYDIEEMPIGQEYEGETWEDYWNGMENAVGEIKPRSQVALRALEDPILRRFVECVKRQPKYLTDPYPGDFSNDIYRECYRDKTRELGIKPDAFVKALFKAAKMYKEDLFAYQASRFDMVQFQRHDMEIDLMGGREWKKAVKHVSTVADNWLTFGNSRIEHGTRMSGDLRGNMQVIYEEISFRFSLRFADGAKVDDMITTIFEIVEAHDFIKWFKIFPREHSGRDDVVFGVMLPGSDFVTKVTLLPNGDQEQVSYFKYAGDRHTEHSEPSDESRRSVITMGDALCNSVATIIEAKPRLFSTELPPFQWKPCPWISGADYKEGQSFGEALTNAFSFFPSRFKLGNAETKLADELPEYEKCATYSNLPTEEQQGLQFGAPNVWDEVKESCLSITIDAWVYCNHPVPQTWFGTWPIESTLDAPNFDRKCIQPMITTTGKLKRTVVQPLHMGLDLETRLVRKPEPGEFNPDYKDSSAFLDGRDPKLKPKRMSSIVSEDAEDVHEFTDEDLPGETHVEVQLSSDSEEYH